MFLMHIILPFVIYFIVKKRDKVMLWGLLLGNLIDLDHIYYRLIGKVACGESACLEGFGSQCSFGTYPLHSLPSVIVLVIVAAASFALMRGKEWKKEAKWAFWIAVGALLNFLLDYIHLVTGFAI